LKFEINLLIKQLDSLTWQIIFWKSKLIYKYATKSDTVTFMRRAVFIGLLNYLYWHIVTFLTMKNFFVLEILMYRT
jgi:hypothetical protein